MNASCKKLVLERGADDIFSGLPRHVLDKIFEHLPTKDAARTSILSKKWRYLWSACPCLVFDRQFFDNIMANKPNSANKYVNLIYKLFLLHDGPVLNFDLYIPNLLNDWDEHIDEWLLFLSRNSIQKLRLNYRPPIPYKLPSYVFSSPKLAYLKLINAIFKPPVSFSGFANLVDLNLIKITFAACSFNGVSPVAPLLRTLMFISCTDIKFFTLSAPRALRMIVSDSSEVTPIFFDKFPKLTTISLLIRAGNRCPMNMIELHEKFPRIKELCINGHYLKLSAATTIERRLSFVFHHLEYLRLMELSFDDLDQILCALWFLNSSPNLEKFRAFVSASKVTDVESILTHLESQDCTGKMLNLRSVKFVQVLGSKPELVFIKYILANSPKLESLHVNYRVSDKDEQLRISNELMRFPRASNKAQVIYGR